MRLVTDAALRPQPKRYGPDYWPTPPCLTEAFVEHITPELPPGPVWEPAAGAGDLARAIEAAGRVVVATDIATGDDFLATLPPAGCRSLATNPPFRLMDEFLKRALVLLDADDNDLTAAALLVRFDHMMADARAAALQRAHSVHVCCWRPRWIPGTKGNGRWAFAWLVWRGGYDGPPVMHWLKRRKARDRPAPSVGDGPELFLNTNGVTAMSDIPTTEPQAAKSAKKRQANGPEDATLPPPTSEPLTAKSAERFRVTGTNYVVQSKEVLATVRIVAPDKSVFVRVHHDPTMEFITYTFATKDGHCLIEPDIFDEIKVKVPDFDKVTSCVSLWPYMTNRGALNLWPLKRETPFSIGGNSYNLSAFNVAAMTRTRWLRVSTNTDRGQYLGFDPEEFIPEPKWPKDDLTMTELIELAAKGGTISSIDHPLIKPYRGLS